MSNNLKYLYYFYAILLLLTGVSCNVGQYMTSDQSLIKNTKIVFKNKNEVIDNKKLTTELNSFITQKPNGKLFFIVPKEYIFLKNSGANKNSFINKSLRLTGESPNFFKLDEAKLVSKNMENYLKYRKGYYHARVDFITEENLRVSTNSWGSHHWTTTDIKYIISTGNRYKIRELNYVSEDKNILSYIEKLRKDAVIKEGDYIDFNSFELEKTRLTLALQNQGFTNFSVNYIDVEGDSSVVNKDIAIDFYIKSPLPDTLHKKYTVGKIFVFSDHSPNIPKDSLIKDETQGVIFYRQSQKHIVKPSLIYNSIFLKENDVLNRENRQKSYRKLNNLGTYRFVTINALPDNVHDTVLNFNVLLTPHAKKWIFDTGLQGYYSTLGDFDLLGLSGSVQGTHRNTFGGSEKFTTRLELGSEVSFLNSTGSSNTIIVPRTTSISFQNSLTIPSYVDFAGMGRLINKVGIIKDKFYKDFVEEANTNISLGFNINDIREFFLIRSGDASYGFDYTSPKGNRYLFKPLGINVDLYSIADESRFNNNPLLLLSFQNILGTGFLFREFTHIYTQPKNEKGHSFLAFNTLELSGVEVHLTNKLINAVSGSDNLWRINAATPLAFSKYIRYQFDGRYGLELDKNSRFASRVNASIILPFGDSQANPFIKQFGVGGPNSLRAWNINQAGPGGFFDRAAQDTINFFVNQADIRLEFNAEYRFNLFWKLEGALFVDAGNIWMLKEDELRPSAHFTKDFLNQIAIGTGYGLRFNFDFFILRFDFGYKIRSPYVDETRPKHWYTFKEIRQQGIGNVQVAVNYPF